jgi:hypothetical protein
MRKLSWAAALAAVVCALAAGPRAEAGPAWTRLADTGAAPPAASNTFAVPPLLAYDAFHARQVAVDWRCHLFEWDPGALAWADVTPAGGQQPGGAAGFAFDAGRAKLVLLDAAWDVWEWDDLAGWQLALGAASPGPDYFYASRPDQYPWIWTYDPAQQKLLLVEANGEGWWYDGAAASWAEAGPGAAGLELGGAAVAFDEARGTLVLFGGQGRSETWTRAGAAGAWTKLAPPGAAPPPRFGAAMAYDRARGRVVLFGGYGTRGPSPGPLDDTWEWDGRAWAKVNPGTSRPAARSQHAMTWDPASAQVLLFGGRTWSTEPSLDDAWAFGAANEPPVLAPIADRSVAAGDLLDMTIGASDADGDPIAYSARDLPPGASFDAAAAELRWTPDATQVGAWRITFVASDGALSDAKTVTITVLDPQAGGFAPSATPIDRGVYRGQEVAGEAWYALALAAGEGRTFAILFLELAGHLDMTLYDSSGNALGAADAPANVETIAFTAPADDVYFLRVRGKNRFTLSVR